LALRARVLQHLSAVHGGAVAVYFRIAAVLSPASSFSEGARIAGSPSDIGRHQAAVANCAQLPRASALTAPTMR